MPFSPLWSTTISLQGAAEKFESKFPLRLIKRRQPKICFFKYSWWQDKNGIESRGTTIKKLLLLKMLAFQRSEQERLFQQATVC